MKSTEFKLVVFNQPGINHIINGFLVRNSTMALLTGLTKQPQYHYHNSTQLEHYWSLSTQTLLSSVASQWSGDAPTLLQRHTAQV